MSMWVSYWPRWLNQLLSMTKIPPAMTGVLQRMRGDKVDYRGRFKESRRGLEQVRDPSGGSILEQVKDSPDGLRGVTSGHLLLNRNLLPFEVETPVKS